MNVPMILHVVCIILRTEAAVMVPAYIISLVHHEDAAATALLITMLCMLAASLIERKKEIKDPPKKSISVRDGFFIVAISWIIVSLFGCLPFYWSREIPSFVDSFFETVSGFTTTGATILTDIESMSMGLLYWRSFTHWLGGMGVLVFVLALVPLASRSGSSMNLLRAESPGPVVDKLVPKISASAKILYAIYIGMTAAQFVLLLLGGMTAFESITTAFGTAGTGGFAVFNDSLAGATPYIQNVVTVFMILFGVNFNLFYLLIIREFSKAIRMTEVWVYLGIMFGSIALITVNVLPMFGGDAGESLHHTAFQVASVMTTTGFATVDFNLWPEFSKMILLTVMFCGACAGSTGGGIKTSRVMILTKAFMRDIRRLARPRSVSVVRIGRQAIDEDVIRTTQAYLGAYLLIFIISNLIVSIDNMSLETTTTAVLSCMSNVGPGLDVVGPMGNYAPFSACSKIVLIADMLLGRLELFPMLVVFIPATYRK